MLGKEQKGNFKIKASQVKKVLGVEKMAERPKEISKLEIALGESKL